MFGYIYVNRSELSEEEKKTYQAYYCGLCRALKKNNGRKGQMLLNYDMTFLILLLTGLYEPDTDSEDFFCPMHPGKRKRAYLNRATQYAADMNVLLSYHNLMDDWKDDKNYPKYLLTRVIKRDYERIYERYPRQARALCVYMAQLSGAEERRERNIDAVAGMTGHMLGEIFAWREDDIWEEELRCLGFYMGKFIYLMDAYEDLTKDCKRKRYNPFEKMREDSPGDFETISRLILTSMISESAKSFERLPILLHADIMRNILYSGVWAKYEYLQKKKKKKGESR